MPEPINLELGTSNPPPSNGDGDNGSQANPIHESFLSSVSDDHKEIVQQYVPEWDKLVTQQFQELNSKLKPYEELGDLDTIQNAMAIIQMADQDPVGFYKYVKESLEEMGHTLEDNDTNNDPGSNLPEFDGVPPEFVNQFKSVTSELEELKAFVNEQKAQQKSQSEQQQLDNLMQKLHNDHGDFDEAAIMGRILQGMEPEKAVADYKKQLEKFVNSPKPPPSLGNGNTPSDQVDKKKLSDPKFRKNHVAALLEASNNS